jgi:hypothetical protein
MGVPTTACRPIHLPWVALWLACAHAGGRSEPHGEEILERGGELGASRAERATVTVTPTTVTVWGLTEVPDGSRMQMAFAGVDAVTRAELLKAVEVRVTGIVTSVESTDPHRRSVVVETVEAVDGLLASAGPLPHGWIRVRQNGEVVIRIWARLEVPRASLQTAIRSVLTRRGYGDPAVGHTATPESADAHGAAVDSTAIDAAAAAIVRGLGGLAP